MGIISWIVFGALAGWVASIVVGGKKSKGCLYHVVIGILGAFIGGFVIEFLGGREFGFTFSLRSFFVAVLGAVSLLLITGAARK